MEIGKIYTVNSIRKGTFKGVLVAENEEFATFEITDGAAKAMLDYNTREKGEQVSVRKSLCTFNFSAAEQYVT